MTVWHSTLRHMITPPPEGQEPREEWWNSGTALCDLPVGIGWTAFFELQRLGSVQHDWFAWHAAVDRAYVVERYGAAVEAFPPEDGWFAIELIEE